MRDFLLFLVKALVDHPDKVILDQTLKDDKIIFTLQVSPEDVGKVIGKNGRNAMALRVLLHAVAAREKKHAVLEIAG